MPEPPYVATRSPRGVAELGQLQDHYHQNDNDQDPDDGPDDSSVHFASLYPRADPPLQIRSLNTRLWLPSRCEPRPGLFSRTQRGLVTSVGLALKSYSLRLADATPLTVPGSRPLSGHPLRGFRSSEHLAGVRRHRRRHHGNSTMPSSDRQPILRRARCLYRTVGR